MPTVSIPNVTPDSIPALEALAVIVLASFEGREWLEATTGLQALLSLTPGQGDQDREARAIRLASWLEVWGRYRVNPPA